MGFNLFKKKEPADAIYMNGHIFTQDPELPWASAVACRNGRVMAVGDFDYMDEITGEDTEIVDLDDRYMLPGFIDVHSSTVLQAFKEFYLEIDPVWDLDTVLDEIESYSENLSEESTVFAYGYNESLLDDYETPEDKAALLDEIIPSRPAAVLGIDGMHLWINTAARNVINAAIDEMGIEVRTPSVSFVLDTLMVFDEDSVTSALKEEEERLTDKGITNVFNYYSPAYFDALYRNYMLGRINEEKPVRQKFHGSYFINRPVNPAFLIPALEHERTFCSELDGLINYNFLKIEASDREELSYFPGDTLNKICLAAADKGFNIHIDALDKETLLRAYRSFNNARSKGYTKNTFVIASDESLTDEEIHEFDFADTICTTYPSDMLNVSVFGHSSSTADAVDKLTVEAAELLGESENLGSIQQGKRADFTVFSENVFECNLKTFSRLHADMVITDGIVSYDAEEENRDEMVDILMNMTL